MSHPKLFIYFVVVKVWDFAINFCTDNKDIKTHSKLVSAVKNRSCSKNFQPHALHAQKFCWKLRISCACINFYSTISASRCGAGSKSHQSLVRAHKFHGAKEIEKLASHFFRVCRRRDEREKIEIDTRASKGCAGLCIMDKDRVAAATDKHTGSHWSARLTRGGSKPQVTDAHPCKHTKLYLPRVRAIKDQNLSRFKPICFIFNWLSWNFNSLLKSNFFYWFIWKSS